MTLISIANIGSYPRVGEDKDQQRYRRGNSHFEHKDISAHAFRDVEQSVIQELVREQLICELDEVTDGQVSWNDPISHFCKNIAGVETKGLLRYFNNNFYYRVPVITGKPRLKEPVLAKEYLYAQSVSNKPVRAVITGPLTLAAHSDSDLKSYKKLNARLDFFTDIVRLEIKALIAAGTKTIQIDEPSLAQMPQYLPAAKKYLEKIKANAGDAKIVLALYFFPLAPLWDALQTMPVQGLQLDFTLDGEKLMKEILKKPGTKEMGFGVVNTRTIRIENADMLALTLRPWIEKNPNRPFTITPSAGLELIPRITAQSKLSLLARIRSALSTGATLV